MSQQIKALATKLKGLCLIPGAYMVEGVNWFPQVFVWHTHVLCAHNQSINKFI